MWICGFELSGCCFDLVILVLSLLGLSAHALLIQHSTRKYCLQISGLIMRSVDLPCVRFFGTCPEF